MKKNDNYIDTFVSEQQQQYTQWNYPLSGKPTPLNEAKGNPLPLAIAYFISSAFFFVLAIFIPYMNCTTIIKADIHTSHPTTTYKFTFNFFDFVPILLFFSIVAIFLLFVGLGFLRKYKAQKLQPQQNRKKKKKRSRK